MVGLADLTGKLIPNHFVRRMSNKVKILWWLRARLYQKIPSRRGESSFMQYHEDQNLPPYASKARDRLGLRV